MLMPVSLREKKEKISDLEINNSVVGLPVEFFLQEDFEMTLKNL